MNAKTDRRDWSVATTGADRRRGLQAGLAGATRVVAWFVSQSATPAGHDCLPVDRL